MKKLIHSFFGVFGLEVRRKAPLPKTVPVPAKKVPAVFSMEAGLLRARDKMGVNADTIIDLGAAQGLWTRKAQEVWPEATYLLFEPLEERKAELEEFARSNPRVQPVFAAAGDSEGEVAFVVSDDLDGSGVFDAQKQGGSRNVKLVTIDAELARRNLSGKCILKFDTHGFEVPILKGAVHTLAKTELVIMECYGFRIAESALLFPDMCRHMESFGFRLADVVEVERRPGDQAFWQCDAFFLRADHPLFKSNKYQ